MMLDKGCKLKTFFWMNETNDPNNPNQRSAIQAEGWLRYVLQHFDFFLKPVTKVHFNHFSFIMGLDACPKLYRCAEIARQTQCCVGADSTFAAAYFTDTHGRNIDVLGQSVLADAHGGQKFFKQNFARVDGGKISHMIASMIVDNLDSIDTVLMPLKTDPPLFFYTWILHELLFQLSRELNTILRKRGKAEDRKWRKQRT